MTQLPLAVSTSVFACAAAFGALIDMYSLRILRDYWSTWSYGEPHRLPWVKDTAVMRRLLGLSTVRYLRTRCVLFPWFELAFASLVLLALFAYGFSWRFFQMSLFFTFALPLATISSLDDPNVSLTPDVLTIPGAVLGLLSSALPDSLSTMHIAPLDRFQIQVLGGATLDGLVGSGAGMVVGYLSLYIPYRVFLWLEGKQGLGHGSMKACMMIGAFGGPLAILPVILISSVSGAVIGNVVNVVKHRDRDAPIPFTPYLMFGGAVAMLGRDSIKGWF